MILSLMLMGLLQASPAPAPQEPLILRGAPLEVRLGQKLQVEAPQGVEFLYGRRRLFIKQVILDGEKEMISGPSEVRLIAPEGRLWGEGFEYNYREERGWFNRAYVETGQGRLWADRIEGSLPEFSASNVQLTTCDKEHPDYLLTAARVRVNSQGQLRASRLRLQWRGHTLLTIPTLSLRLRQGTGELTLPTPTYSSLTGFGLRWSQSVPMTRRGEVLLGGAVYRSARLETQARFAWNLAEPELPPLDREEGARFQTGYMQTLLEEDPNADLERDSLAWIALQRLGNVRAIGRKTKDLFISKPWELSAAAGGQFAGGAGSLLLRFGTLEEWRGGVHVPLHSRLGLEGQWSRALLGQPPEAEQEESEATPEDSPKTGMGEWESGGVREKKYGGMGVWEYGRQGDKATRGPLTTSPSLTSPKLLFHLQAATFFYEGNKGFSWVRPQIEYIVPLSDTSRVGIAYLRSFRFGETPFLFDDLDTRHELRARGETRMGNFRIAVLLKYDLEESELFDVQFLLGIWQHCIEPTLFWRKSPGDFRIGVNLTAVR